MTKANEQVERIMGALLCNQDGGKLSTASLMAASGCNHREIYMRVTEARARFAKMGSKLCNLRGVGYWLANCEGDKLDEAAKQYRRGFSHLAAGNATMALVDRSQITTVEDMEVFGINTAIQAMTKALMAGNAETIRRLATARQTHARLEAASVEAAAPTLFDGE